MPWRAAKLRRRAVSGTHRPRRCSAELRRFRPSSKVAWRAKFQWERRKRTSVTDALPRSRQKRDVRVRELSRRAFCPETKAKARPIRLTLVLLRSAERDSAALPGWREAPKSQWAERGQRMAPESVDQDSPVPPPKDVHESFFFSLSFFL